MTLRNYLLSNVFRSPDEPAAATPAAGPGGPAAGASDAAPAAAAAAPAAAAASSGDGAAKAADAAPAAPAAAPAADGAAAAADAKPESTPSLLEAANAKPDAKAGDKPADTKAAKDDAAAAKPADGAKPATEAKPDPAKAPAEKPADAKAKTDEAAAPAKEALAEKPQARSYEAFKVPEGAKLDDKQVKSFTDVLEAADLGHQDRAQKLVDMHVAEMQRVVQEQVTNQRKVWDDYNNQLKAELKADPELGGNRADTVLGYAKAVVEQFGGTEEQVADTLKMMTHTGMGNYIGMARLLSNIYEKAVAAKVVPGTPPSRGGSRKSFQDVAYGEPGASGPAS